MNRETPEHIKLHLIVDNYVTYKHPKVKAGWKNISASIFQFVDEHG